MYYMLDEDKNVVSTDNVTEWKENRKKIHHVALDNVGEYRVSTVFLGLDHQWGEGPPLVFETMIFKGDDYEDFYCERYSTYDEAVSGHKYVVDHPDIESLFYEYEE